MKQSKIDIIGIDLGKNWFHLVSIELHFQNSLGIRAVSM